MNKGEFNNRVEEHKNNLEEMKNEKTEKEVNAFKNILDNLNDLYKERNK